VRQQQPHQVVRPVEVDGDVVHEVARVLGVQLRLPCQGFDFAGCVGESDTYRSQAVGAGVVDEDVDPAMQLKCLYRCPSAAASHLL
jgi:hypothetical protein